MKKLTVILLVLITSVSYAQSTIYDDNEMAEFSGNQTGRFVYSYTDLKVTNMGDGMYKISIYGKGESKPDASFIVEFKKINSERLYQYHSATNPTYPIVMTQNKLSKIADGRAGRLGIQYNRSEGVIFQLGREVF